MVTASKPSPSLTLFDYEIKIRELYPILCEYPESESLKRKMYDLLSPWADLADVTVFQSPEEHYPWTAKELCHPVQKMPTKKLCGFDQTGDYIAYWRSSGREGWIPILVERKGGKNGVVKKQLEAEGEGAIQEEAKKGTKKAKGNPDDLYNTLSNGKSRHTFYDEIRRFYADPRFYRMYIIAECSMEDYIDYIPRFNGGKRNYNHVGVSVPSREATVAGLVVRDSPILFMGSRRRAITLYRNIIRLWLIYNYEFILGLKAEQFPINLIKFT